MTMIRQQRLFLLLNVAVLVGLIWFFKGSTMGNLPGHVTKVSSERRTAYIDEPRTDLWKRRSGVPHLAFVICGDRIPEAMVMLKSALLFTKVYLNLHIIVEDDLQSELKRQVFRSVFRLHHLEKELYLKDVSLPLLGYLQLESLPTQYRSRMEYKTYSTSFPPDITCKGCKRHNWKTMFRLCSSQRLFLGEMLPDLDSILYVDLDVLFLAPVEELWSHIFKFNETQYLAAAPFSVNRNGGFYNNRKGNPLTEVPFIPPTGINCGVFLMNLTRLRRTTWQESLSRNMETYNHQLILHTQDLVNIYMARHPESTYFLPCEWNYRYYFCTNDNRCPTADREGAALLHGLAFHFHNNDNPAFKATFSAFEQNYFPRACGQRSGCDVTEESTVHCKYQQWPRKCENCGKVEP